MTLPGRLVALTRLAATPATRRLLATAAAWLGAPLLAGALAGGLAAMLAIPAPPPTGPAAEPVVVVADPSPAPAIAVEPLPPPDMPVPVRLVVGPPHRPAELAPLYFAALEGRVAPDNPRRRIADLPRHGGGDDTLRRLFAAEAVADAMALAEARAAQAEQAEVAADALALAEASARAQAEAADEARRAALEALALQARPHPGPPHRPAELYLLLAGAGGPESPSILPGEPHRMPEVALLLARIVAGDGSVERHRPEGRDPGRFVHALPEPDSTTADALRRPGPPHTMPEIVLLYAALAEGAGGADPAIAIGRTGWLLPPVPGDRPDEAPATTTVAITETGPEPAIEVAPLAPPVDPGSAPLVAIMIDDMGLNAGRNERVSALPGPLTLAYIPYGEGLGPQTRLAAASGHEVFLHLPMQPIDPGEDPGPHALLAGLAPEELAERLAWNLDRFEGYVGVNNHMGSLLTQDAAAMDLVMAELSRRGLIFVDSVTSAGSVAYETARAWGIPAAERSVFLDNEPEVEAVLAQLDRLEEVARSRGAAIGIGHPHDATLEALAVWLPAAAARGVQLVPASRIIAQGQLHLAGNKTEISQ